MYDVTCLIDARCELAECPVWDNRAEKLYWCDITGCAIHSHDWSSGERESWTFADTVGSFGLCDDGRLVVARRDRIVLFDMANGEETHLADIEADNPHTRTNDGKVGPDGAFWVGTMDDRSPRQPIAGLYRVGFDGEVRKIASAITVSNGLAWSPDGLTLYHADSRPGFIDTWAFDPETGTASDRHRLIDLADDAGRPDGGTVDTEGHYWSAGISAGVINRISPAGAIFETVEMPVPAPTMPCFCGPDLDTMVVTSLRPHGNAKLLDEYPMSGSLFAFKPGVLGLPPYRFRTA